MKLLFIGDIVGKGGRKAVKKAVPELKRKFNCGFVIANAENIAAGAGLAAKCINDLDGTVDVFTSGDHVWDQKNFVTEINQFKNVLRPANMSLKQPGKGFGVFRNPACGDIAVINLMGKVFMRESAYCPFETVDKVLSGLPPAVKTVIVDFHTEATSEKAAMGYYLDGRVTAVLGTHTHVQTADAKILSRGTAFISDVGMTGANYSILGREVEAVLKKFTTGMPTRLPVVEKGIRLDAVVIEYSPERGSATGITPISLDVPSV
jgi:hypothetical protein